MRDLTATEWERAAIVAAFVTLSDSKAHIGDPRGQVSSDLTACHACADDRRHGTHEFAAHRITGLRSKNTIARYVRAWLEAHAGEYPEPGQDVELPTTSET